MSVNVRKLSEEEICKLPFPETARAIGGILEYNGKTLAQEIQEMRAAWKKQLAANPDVVWKSVFIGGSDDRK